MKLVLDTETISLDKPFIYDLGYVIDNQIIGIINFKIMFIGYPTIWFNDMFK